MVPSMIAKAPGIVGATRGVFACRRLEVNGHDVIAIGIKASGRLPLPSLP